MRSLVTGCLSFAATLGVVRSSHADVSWQQATVGSIAFNQSLVADGRRPCRVHTSTGVFLGRLDGDLRCHFRTAAQSDTSAAAPGYSYLTAQASDTRLAAMTLPLRDFPGVPGGVVRAGADGSGPALCGIGTALGWFDAAAKRCRVRGDSGEAQVLVQFFATTPARRFVDLPRVWRDGTTAAGTTGALGYCRGSLTPTAPRTTPGLYLDSSGGMCSFFVGNDASGQPTFSATTDKRRFDVLLPSLEPTHRVIPWGLDTNARLRIGVVGNDHVFGCWRPGVRTAAGQTIQPARGLYLWGKCMSPPASGSGSGVAHVATISDEGSGFRLPTVFTP